MTNKFQDVEDLTEMTSGVKSGLKSWLAFGSSIAGSQGTFHNLHSVRLISNDVIKRLVGKF